MYPWGNYFFGLDYTNFSHDVFSSTYGWLASLLVSRIYLSVIWWFSYWGWWIDALQDRNRLVFAAWIIFQISNSDVGWVGYIDVLLNWILTVHQISCKYCLIWIDRLASLLFFFSQEKHHNFYSKRKRSSFSCVYSMIQKKVIHDCTLEMLCTVHLLLYSLENKMYKI